MMWQTLSDSEVCAVALALVASLALGAVAWIMRHDASAASAGRRWHLRPVAGRLSGQLAAGGRIIRCDSGKSVAAESGDHLDGITRSGAPRWHAEPATNMIAVSRAYLSGIGLLSPLAIWVGIAGIEAGVWFLLAPPAALQATRVVRRHTGRNGARSNDARDRRRGFAHLSDRHDVRRVCRGGDCDARPRPRACGSSPGTELPAHQPHPVAVAFSGGCRVGPDRDRYGGGRVGHEPHDRYRTIRDRDVLR